MPVDYLAPANLYPDPPHEACQPSSSLPSTWSFNFHSQYEMPAAKDYQHLKKMSKGTHTKTEAKQGKMKTTNQTHDN